MFATLLIGGIHVGSVSRSIHAGGPRGPNSPANRHVSGGPRIPRAASCEAPISLVAVTSRSFRRLSVQSGMRSFARKTVLGGVAPVFIAIMAAATSAQRHHQSLGQPLVGLGHPVSSLSAPGLVVGQVLT